MACTRGGAEPTLSIYDLSSPSLQVSGWIATLHVFLVSVIIHSRMVLALSVFHVGVSVTVGLAGLWAPELTTWFKPQLPTSGPLVLVGLPRIIGELSTVILRAIFLSGLVTIPVDCVGFVTLPVDCVGFVTIPVDCVGLVTIHVEVVAVLRDVSLTFLPLTWSDVLVVLVICPVLTTDSADIFPILLSCCGLVQTV